jgi:hypothetical protein
MEMILKITCHTIYMEFKFLREDYNPRADLVRSKRKTISEEIIFRKHERTISDSYLTQNQNSVIPKGIDQRSEECEIDPTLSEKVQECMESHPN